MKRRLLTILGCSVIGFVALGGGYLWGISGIGRLEQFTVTQPLELQAAPGSVGTLPVGTVLYRYRVREETDTYIVFVSSENRSILAPASRSADGFEIRPIYAYLPKAN